LPLFASEEIINGVYFSIDFVQSTQMYRVIDTRLLTFLVTLLLIILVQTKRSDNHPRVLLSSDLVVEHLLNDGKFIYNGQEHIDHSYQAANQGVFRRLAARGVTKAMKFAFRSSTQEHVKRNGLTWDDFPYLTISDGYEFAAEDVVSLFVLFFQARPCFLLMCLSLLMPSLKSTLVSWLDQTLMDSLARRPLR
jgi:hypothetical protein